MRVTFLSENFPPETGAPQIRLYEISKELIRLGHDVEVITAFPHHPDGIIPDEYKGKFYEFEHYHDIPVHRTWIYPSPKGSFWKRLFSYFSFVFSSFYSVFKSQKTDVIICTSPPLFLGITGYFASKIKRAKFVFNVADIWPESAVELGILKNKTFIKMAQLLESWLYKRSWKIAAATEGIRDYLIGKGKKKERVFLLPNGVNTEVFSPSEPNTDWQQRLGFEGKKVFTFAGRIGYAQGLDAVLNAAKIVEKADPSIRFLIIGEGPEKEKLMKQKEELALSNLVFHKGVPVTEMPNVFSITDFSLVSLRKLDLFKGARPSKIFPALSSGVPVVYCGEGEGAALITDNNCGVAAEPENPEAIAEAVLQCSNMEKEEYDTLLNSGREFVLKEYSWKTIVDNLLENIEPTGRDSL